MTRADRVMEHQFDRVGEREHAPDRGSAGNALTFSAGSLLLECFTVADYSLDPQLPMYARMAVHRNGSHLRFIAATWAVGYLTAVRYVDRFDRSTSSSGSSGTGRP